jgi:flavin-binding protein dodecin
VSWFSDVRHARETSALQLLSVLERLEKARLLIKNHVYKILELVGSSETSIEDAISRAVAQANKTVRNMDWFEVVQTRGHIENGKIRHYQVTLKIGFSLEA